jgi:hypothetical protein
MTDDPITAVLQQLADQLTQLTQLTELVTGIGDTLREHEAALAKLTQTPPADADGYHPSPPPSWWKLAATDRAEPIARIHAWVEQVYRPGYGHLVLRGAQDSDESGFQRHWGCRRDRGGARPGWLFVGGGTVPTAGCRGRWA